MGDGLLKLTLSDVIVMKNPHTGNKTTGLSRAAFPVINNGPVFKSSQLLEGKQLSEE